MCILSRVAKGLSFSSNQELFKRSFLLQSSRAVLSLPNCPAMPPHQQAHGINDAPGITDWFYSLPPITRYWFGGAALITVAGNFNVLPPYQFVYDFASVKNSFQVWRFLTSFLYAGQFSFSTLMGVYMLYQFSKQYETGGPYNTGGGGGTADYAFCLLFGMVGCLAMYHVLVGLVPLAPIFTRNLTFYVLYVWGRKNPTTEANVWAGIRVKGMYLPFAYLVLNGEESCSYLRARILPGESNYWTGILYLFFASIQHSVSITSISFSRLSPFLLPVLMGNPYFDILVGIALGHAFYFLVDVYPLVYGRDVLHTPQFLIDYFGVGEYVPPVEPVGGYGGGGGGFASPGSARPPSDPASSSARRSGGHNWGSGGQRLGAT